MAWPNVSIRLGYIMSTTAQLGPYVTNFNAVETAAPYTFAMDSDWTLNNPVPPAIGSEFASFTDFETAWFGQNTLDDPTGQLTLFKSTNILCGPNAEFPVGSPWLWGDISPLGTIQAFIESEAAFDLQTPEEWLAANDPFYRGLWGGLPDAGYCFQWAYQSYNLGSVPPGLVEPAGGGDLGFGPDFYDCDPLLYGWTGAAAIAVFFITISADDQLSLDKIANNVTGGMQGDVSTYDKDHPAPNRTTEGIR